MSRALLALWIVHLLVALSAGSCSEQHPIGFVLDNEGVLTSAQKSTLDSLFRAHEERTGNEIALVTHPTFNGRPAKDFAVAFGDSVGVGKKDRDNGVLIALCKARREVFIATGKGTERVLHDSICQRIVDQEMLPRFKLEDHYGGLLSGCLAIIDFLDRPENRIP